MQRELQKLSSIQISKTVPSQTDIVILPVGTIEAHGSACIGTDNYIPEDISLGIAERINALVAPVVNYGITRSLYRHAGGITVSPETFHNYIREILDSLDDVGFKRIIVMNGHGGNNTVLKSVAAAFHRERRSNVAVLHWWQLCEEMTNDFWGHAGGHAGTDEAAMVQAIDPELLSEEDYDPDLAYNFNSGADIYPIPGTILLYKKGEGHPQFDRDKSKAYRSKVIEKVGDFTESILNRWKKLGL